MMPKGSGKPTVEASKRASRRMMMAFRMIAEGARTAKAGRLAIIWTPRRL
jgi:hypothetical protein